MNLTPIQTGVTCRNCGTENLGWYATKYGKWRLVALTDRQWTIHYCNPVPVKEPPMVRRPLRDPSRIMHTTNLHATFACPYCRRKIYVERDEPQRGASSWHTFVEVLPSGLSVPHAKNCAAWADHRRRERAAGKLLQPRPKEVVTSQYGTAHL